MVFFTDSTGQLGNQLFEFSTFIANALERETKVLNLFFNKYQEHFEGPNSSNIKSVRTSLGNSKLDYLLRRVLGNPKFQSMLISAKSPIKGDGSPIAIDDFNSKGKILFKYGAWFTNFTHFYKHQEIIKIYFKPLPHYVYNIENFIRDFRSKYDIVVGIHIRKGDYKDFLGGQFYFEDEVYKDMLRQMEELFPDKKVGFIICSNE